jgi:beta-lactamase regulating signal transducer with metallopeptidase domain
MISNPFFILSLFISSLFAFFTTAVLVEIFLKIFRIQKHRIRSTLRLLPVFNVGIDLILNPYSTAYWINPLNCSSCLHKLFLPLKDYLAERQLFVVFFLCLGISLFFFLKKMVQAFFLARLLHAQIKNCSLYQHSMTSPYLERALKKHKVRIYLSQEVQVPLTVYPKIIIIPQKMQENLSEQEFEAVIAHEWGHVQSQDSLIRFFIHAIAGFFWWVPMRFWIQKIEQDQEMACDQNVIKYGISSDSLASALCKVVRQLKTHELLCYFKGKEHCMWARIQHILGLEMRDQNYKLGLNILVLTAGGCLLLICMMVL